MSNEDIVKDAFNIDKIHKSFAIIIDEMDDSIDWIFSRLETYPITLPHEYTYTIDIAKAYRKKVEYSYTSIKKISDGIIDPEIRAVYDTNLEHMNDRIHMIDEIILEFDPVASFIDDKPKYFS